MYYKNKFLCLAICPKLSTETVSLKEIQTARNQRRKQLKQQIKDRVSIVDALMGNKKQSPQTATEPEQPPAPNKPKKPALKRYYND